MPIPAQTARLLHQHRHVWSALMLCATMALTLTGQARSATSTVQAWGTTSNGQANERVTLQNDRGMRLSYINYGATLVSVEVPDRLGKQQNIMLSLPDLGAYERTQRRFSAIMGRYAGRIGNAQFTLNGKVIQLEANARGVSLHGDPNGFDRRLWQRQDFSDATSIGSVFEMISPDGDQRFPGRLIVQVTYRLLRKSNEFRIEYQATTDQPTVINFTNHGYFNLAGAGSSGLASHRFQIMADRYTETDAKRIPTGAILSVAGTALDFRVKSGVAQRLSSPSELLGDPPGIDHSLLFTQTTGKLARVAVIDELHSGRRMEVRTTEPSVQFNTGNGFDGSEIGSEGIGYQKYAGFAFETQHLPDSPNHPHFPSTVLLPGQTYRSLTSFHFSAQ